MAQVKINPGTSVCGERGGNHSNGVKNFHLINGSSQGQNLTLAVLYVPSSLDSGTSKVDSGTSKVNSGTSAPHFPRLATSGDTTPCRMTGVTL